MTSPSEAATSIHPAEGLRARLRPRALQGGAVGASERFALERIQALEVQVAAGHERERALGELAVRGGNRMADMEGAVEDPTDLAARTQAWEGAMFEAEGRAE